MTKPDATRARPVEAPGLVPRFSLRVRNPGLGVGIDVPAADRVDRVGLQIPSETPSTEPRGERGMAPGERIEGVSQLRIVEPPADARDRREVHGRYSIESESHSLDAPELARLHGENLAFHGVGRETAATRHFKIRGLPCRRGMTLTDEKLTLCL